MVDGGDAGADLAAAAVEALRSTGFVRASTDAVELRAIVTLVEVRRRQARDEARARAAARAGGAGRAGAEASRAEAWGPLGPVRREDDCAEADAVGDPVVDDPGARVDEDLVDRCTAQEISLALTLSPVVARDRMELALELVHRRPATFEALRTGRIDLVRARRISDAVRHLRPVTVQRPDPSDADPGRTSEVLVDVAALVEAEALDPGSVPVLTDLRPARPAGDLTPAQLTARLARLVLRADPAAAMDRTEQANQRRGCTLRALPDGMALLSITGRGDLLSAAFQRIDAAARALQRDDQATAGQPRRPRCRPRRPR